MQPVWLQSQGGWGVRSVEGQTNISDPSSAWETLWMTHMVGCNARSWAQASILLYRYIFIDHLLYAKHYRAKDPITSETDKSPCPCDADTLVGGWGRQTLSKVFSMLDIVSA